MTTISRTDFIAAIEAGIAAAEGRDDFTPEIAEALREHGRTATTSLVGRYEDEDGARCPACAVLNGEYADTMWDLSFAGGFDARLGGGPVGRGPRVVEIVG